MRELLAKLAVVEGPDALSREAQRNATLLFFAHTRAMLVRVELFAWNRCYKGFPAWLTAQQAAA